MSWRADKAPNVWARYIPKKLRTIIRISFLLSLPFVFIFICGAFYYVSLAKKFDISQVGKLPQKNIIYDRHGIEMDAIIGSNIDLISYHQLPAFMVKALQAREDSKFFTHSGVDVMGLCRATLRNIKDRKFTQGASTLSMQLARNTYEIRAKSLHRKFLEIALTLRVEQNYSKEEIMAGYLNRIYFGVGAGHLGVQDASLNYFGKNVKDLNEGECAMLIGIIRGPHIFSPWRDLEAAEHQRNQVLKRMVDMKFITTEQMQSISSKKIKITPRNDKPTEKSYVVQAVLNEINNIVTPDDIQSGGLKIYTTLDSSWQRRLENELTGALNLLESSSSYKHPKHSQHINGEKTDYLQMAAITLETTTGAVLAQIGGRDYTQSKFDRSDSARRDLGTAFAPFVAAAAVERNFPIVANSPVATGKQVGPKVVANIAERCGLTGPFLYTEDIFRGAASATTKEMAVGLATLANQGKRPTPFLIQKVCDSSGEVLFQSSPNMFPAITQKAAEQALQTLSQNTGTNFFTGATGSEREAWTLRLGPRGSTAIWCGYDVPQVITEELKLRAFLNDIVTRLDNESF